MTAPVSVAIVDTGGANLASLRYALDRLGAETSVTSDAARIRAASHVILPGVGAAGDAMQRLAASGLDQEIPTLTQPVLGICLGMHLMGTRSDEDDVTCLGIFDGPVERIPAATDRPVPHMGWNQLSAMQAVPALAGLPSQPHYYFVHSYAMSAALPECTASYNYGDDYAAVIQRDNFVGVQFHPERSAANGQRLLGNFLGTRTC